MLTEVFYEGFENSDKNHALFVGIFLQIDMRIEIEII